LECFKKLQENVDFYQNKCHPRNAPDTRRLCAKATDMWAQWVAGQTLWLACPTLQPHVSFLGGDTLQEEVGWNPRPAVGGGHAPWLAGHVARPAGQHLARYRINQVSNFSWDTYKYPHANGIHTQHTLLVVLHL
jgi:hypothetical protein